MPSNSWSLSKALRAGPSSSVPMMRLSSLSKVVAIRIGLPPTIWKTVASAPVTSLTRSTSEVSPLAMFEPKASLPSAVTCASPLAAAKPRSTSAPVRTRACTSAETVREMSRRTTYSRTAAKATNTVAVTTRMRATRERRHHAKADMSGVSAGTRRR